jgi:hypothetical protein
VSRISRGRRRVLTLRDTQSRSFQVLLLFEWLDQRAIELKPLQDIKRAF